MKLGIVGVGVVGGALKKWLETHTDHKIVCNDRLKGMDDDFSGVSAVFVAIPVPTTPEKEQDLRDLNDVLETLEPLQVPVFIKSTVLPKTCDSLSDLHGLEVYAMPEFLTERTAYEDFESQPVITGAIPHRRLLEAIFPGKDLIIMSNREAELVKYAHNAFCAVKVGFFNIIRETSDRLGCNYDAVVAGARLSGFIEETHTKVPGPDERCGFGGKCLPKDLSAFVGFLLKGGQPGFASLGATLLENDYFRRRVAVSPVDSL